MAALVISPPSGLHSRSRPHFSHSLPMHSPPSPPMEDNNSHKNISLPSISSLLGIADGGSPIHEGGPHSVRHSPQPDSLHQTSHFRSTSRPSSRHMMPALPQPQSQHRDFPPTPPLSTDVSVASRSSPAKHMAHLPRPAHALAPARPSGYYHETTPPLEVEHHSRSYHPAPPAPYAHQQHHTAPYPERQQPPSNYYQPAPPLPVLPAAAAPPPPAGLQYQRPLPQSFPPPATLAPPTAAPNTSPQVPNPWQHHHYLSPSQSAPYAQAQDRYICATCNKAFSRPSSLRIHSHSHTGEKPFKCPHSGCGKAFSVRSNMKRHERGCHSFDVSPGGPHMNA